MRFYGAIPITPLPMEVDYTLSDYAFTARVIRLYKKQQEEIDDLQQRVTEIEKRIGINLQR